ncbi:class I SAM-dependent methyltransferase [Chloroflexota bacterium]
MTSRFGGYEAREFVAEYYDIAYEQLGPKDIDFFIDCSKKTNGQTLELGCGTGRVLVPTAASGCRITGLDLSPYMLEKCQKKLKELPAEVQNRVKLIQENMADFETGETYSLVTVPFRAFQHLTSVEEQKSCLVSVNRHLVLQGRLIIDVFNPFPPRLVYSEKYSKEIEDLPETRLPDGRKLRRTNRTAAFHYDSIQ